METWQAADGRWGGKYGFPALGPRTPGAGYVINPVMESEAKVKDMAGRMLRALDGPLGWLKPLMAFCKDMDA